MEFEQDSCRNTENRLINILYKNPSGMPATEAKLTNRDAKFSQCTFVHPIVNRAWFSAHHAAEFLNSQPMRPPIIRGNPR